MTKTKHEVVDLKPENVTEDQLNKIQDQVKRINNFQLEVGIVETKKHALLHQIGSIQNEILETQEELKKEYGTADVNIETGQINYPENGEADKED
jgi:peptidoglycan hydrolase CwlO-like protein|tara:strand:- start:68 stop:352 length:285 start_codon:yes stop_codon:yes gene_type:complete